MKDEEKDICARAWAAGIHGAMRRPGSSSYGASPLEFRLAKRVFDRLVREPWWPADGRVVHLRFSVAVSFQGSGGRYWIDRTTDERDWT